MNDKGHPSWCSTCQQGPVRSLGALHSWCTNCGALYGEKGVELPTRIGPDPKERRIAWDKYASDAGMKDSGAAAKHADLLLEQRDARFSPRPEVKKETISG